jgi:type IV secretory pathway protease TraF
VPRAVRVLALASVAAPVAALSLCLYVVDGRSMAPTLPAGALVIAVPFLRSDPPRRGDIVILRDAWRAVPSAVKRVAAVPGDCVSAARFSVVRAAEAAAQSCTTLDANRYLVVGDNHGYSTDSRTLGPVTRDTIVARVVLGLWPPAVERRLASAHSSEVP